LVAILKCMEIKFTLHALERIKERGITLEEVVQCLIYLDKIERDSGKTVFYKLNDKKTELLILVCTIDNVSCKIITAFRTSKIYKYL